LIASTFPLTSEMLAFKDTPLERSLNIRLVEMLPGKNLEGTQCKMMSVGGNNPYPCLALSYTWGDATVTAPILLNREIFEVTENLKSALHHLRDPEISYVLWIDAIYINQDNTEDRYHQVRRMKSIYEIADRDSRMAWHSR
jgi:hypothetical protein